MNSQTPASNTPEMNPPPNKSNAPDSKPSSLSGSDSKHQHDRWAEKTSSSKPGQNAPRPNPKSDAQQHQQKPDQHQHKQGDAHKPEAKPLPDAPRK